MNFVLFRRKNQAVGSYGYSFLTLEVEVFDVWKARGWMVSGTGPRVGVQIGEDCQASCGARVIVRASRIASWIEQLHLIHYIEAIAN